MLDAFSLGSLSRLTTHPHLLKWLPRHVYRNSHPEQRVRLIASISSRHIPPVGGEGSSRAQPLLSLKIPRVGTASAAQQGNVEDSGVESSEEQNSRSGDEQSASRPTSEIVQSSIVVESPSFFPGRSKYQLPLRPLYGGKYLYGKKFLPSFPQHPAAETSGTDANATSPRTDIPSESPYACFYRHLHVLANTQSSSEAWEAYSSLSKLPTPQDRSQGPKIPFEHLHRLCRLLARKRPRTRTQFLRLLSILYTLRESGGMIHPFEWNALIANAGSGWRAIRPTDFKLAFDIFHEMASGMPPGSTLSPSDHPPLDDYQPVTPDMFSYNTLINIATKTLYGRAVRRATGLLRASGHSPDRFTHLALLTFFTASVQITGIRATLLKMRQQGLELGLDGVNSCIWAFNKAGRLDTVRLIYHVLRHQSLSDPRLQAENDPDGKSIAEARAKLDDECIFITEKMKPNETTFTAMIQVMAYHGDFHAAINIFLDMLASDNIEVGAPLVRGANAQGEVDYSKYSPTYAVFRALFLGFARHGTDDAECRTWSLDNLREIYHDFMAFPDLDPPSRAKLYWILLAFDKTSGHDVEIIREVWLQMEEQFSFDWGNRLRQLRAIIFSDDAEHHLHTMGFRLSPPTDEYELPTLEKEIWG
ncbi:hypothetical protein V5O48_001118 [Marasmius crinis-equi]|uniref:Pentatricopeptide repeat-containing protein n=1 Tax=Marasmius crinis-equi TaxID=585013 RepID=A0ABR3FZG4_9AGAR